MNEQQELERNIERAALSYKRSDAGRWAAAYFAAQVVGTYELGATIRLANRMACSTDTVENLAHAYMLYNELRRIPEYRQVMRSMRRLPFMYYSYWRSLYKAKRDYGLTLEQVFKILVDMVQAEGGLRQGDLDKHIQERYGDTRTWHYFGARAMKEIHKALSQPDLPDSVKAVLLPAYEVLGEQS